MVKSAILVLVAACLAAASGQRPEELPWGGLVEDVAGDGRQASTTASSTSTLLANLVTNVVAPLLQNIATGITNAITATFANRTLRYIPVPAPYVAEPVYRLPSRPYDGYPPFYREPPSRPADPAQKPSKRRPAPVDSSEHN